MASVNTKVCSAQDGTLTLEDMKIRQKKFAKEAFEFLLKNAHKYVEYPKSFVTSHETLNKSVVFTDSVGKTIIAIAYMLRTEYRNRFKEIGELLRDPKMYEEYLSNFKILKDNHYFYHFLSWVAFAFDLTMYCLKAGYNHIWRGERCIANYHDIEYFNSRGGFRSLIEKSVIVDLSALYNTMKPVTGQDRAIAPVMKRIKDMERRDRYNNKWLRHLSEIERKLPAKYRVAASLDPERVITGYKVILKKSPKKLAQNKSSESKIPVSEATKLDPGKKDETVIDLVSRMSQVTISEGGAGGSDIPRSRSESSYPLNTDDSEPIFLMHKRFLDKRKESRKGSRNKRGLIICSPSKESGRLDMNLTKLLEENIKGGHFSKIGDDIYANCPPDHSIYDLDTKVIVLDTSSEEEDCDTLDPLEYLQTISSRYFVSDVLSNFKLAHDTADSLASDLTECFKFCFLYAHKAHSDIEVKEAFDSFRSNFEASDILSVLSEVMASIDRIELQLKEASTESATVVTDDQFKCTKAKSKERDFLRARRLPEKKNVSEITSAVSKERATSIPSEREMATSSRITEGEAKQSSTEEHSEQKSFVPTESTGARPKIRKNTSKGSLRKVLPTDNRSGDSKDSDQKDERGKSNIPKKSRKGKNLRK